jgi:hypothetical protein
MTFAEIFIFAVVVALFFFIMNPLRQRLETRIYKAFSKSSRSKKPVDIPLKPSDYTKKESPHE